MHQNSIFIIDEVHKALNDTKRTSVALEISHLARNFVALTGTPVVDSKTYKLIWCLEQIVPFEINESNFWVSANSMISKKVNTGIKTDRKEILAKFTVKEEKDYLRLVVPKMGGSNPVPSADEWLEAANICYQAADKKMIRETEQMLKKNIGVMLIAQNSKHQTKLLKLVLQKINIKKEDIFLLKGGDSIFLTDEAVKMKKVHDYKIVIVPIRKAEGYSLTRLGAMISSVYPSNNATREQIEGRINRIGQKRDTVYYRIVHCGILTYILKHHDDARVLSLALKSLAEKY